MEMWGKVALQHTHIGDTIVPQHIHSCTISYSWTDNNNSVVVFAMACLKSMLSISSGQPFKNRRFWQDGRQRIS